ncbi:hypothetical protein BLL52_2575 [Rhodoferax antarcticus ANT.BR]|uniref:Uncharacterized protein n=1 Tax=Rhodoferax antarcticus ANT.BR TaxID=1111071 RepID=A0A1Q8YE49_9BURK|nr:hypothetical protein BLL52_2575 [Rhodoferax antarcticus ANT.BR]
MGLVAEVKAPVVTDGLCLASQNAVLNLAMRWRTLLAACVGCRQKK